MNLSRIEQYYEPEERGYALRKTTVEPVFKQIKQAWNFRQFLLRGAEKVSSECALLCATHTLLKLYRACAG